MRPPVERKYALVKVERGDYLLPDNDGARVWRVARYIDGPSLGLDDLPRDRPFWGVWKWAGASTWETADNLLDWGDWEMVDSLLDTRQEAIDSALS